MIKNKKSVRLEKHIIPIHYKIELAPDMNAWVFGGKEELEVKIEKGVKSITLHAKDLDIESVEIVQGKVKQFAQKINYNTENETLMVDIDTDLNNPLYQLVMLNLKDTSIKKRATYKVHRLVCAAFIPLVHPIHKKLGKDNLTVNHKNGKKRDNSIENLEWMTMTQNIDHAILSGLHDNSGWKNPAVKRSPKEIITICEMIRDGYSDKEIALHFKNKLDSRRINDIRHKRKWDTVSDLYFKK